MTRTLAALPVGTAIRFGEFGHAVRSPSWEKLDVHCPRTSSASSR
ncbi:hypothetical protein P9139_16060 [Curtobacterium flaccumfaciens]|nr:hypothetical protein P9139_16060 [Curtobacterium flaccumfaciens]